MSTAPNHSAAGQIVANRKLPEFAASLELLKPVTWFPPMWAFMCGVVSAGGSLSQHVWEIAVGMALAGPLVCAMSQAINDWHDRHVDAINEPDRPIPSGRVPGKWGLYIAILWSALSLLVANLLGPVVVLATAIGLFMAWAYSAPPLRLKRNGWAGCAAVAISYEGLAWFTGAAVIAGGVPSWPVLALAFLYSAGAHGIMTLNDFKAVEGDKATGINSLPVMLGMDRAARVASIVMTVPQIIVVALLFHWGLPVHAMIVAALLAAQIVLMFKLLLDRAELLLQPKRNAALYNASGTTLYVLGMLVSALGIGLGILQ